MSNVDKSGLHKQTETIKYVRKDIPKFGIPEYKGKRYESLVPDTLDIEERAALAVNGLTGPTDPKADYALYFSVLLLRNPPMMLHDASGICIFKFWESLPLMRIISGSDLNMNIEKRWMEVMLHMIGPDGLPYFPLKSMPWMKNCLEGFPGGSDVVKNNDHFTVPGHSGRQLGAMTIYYLLTKDPVWKDEGRKIVQGLQELSIDKGDYAYFPECILSLGSPRSKATKMPTPTVVSSFVGWAIQGLVQYYRATGYEPAITLSGKLIKYMKDYGGYYDVNGNFLPSIDDLGRAATHFHLHALPLLGVLEHAIAIGDRELIEYVNKGYNHGKASGNTLVGYFPEHIGHQAHMNSEICEVADMIALGIKLTQAGAGDYWDDVDRWVRNQFAEGQLLQVDWVYRHAAKLPISQIDESYQTSDNVPERNIGAFSGWPSANDWFGGLESHPYITPDRIGWVIQHCCTGNGTRAMYYVWENILNYTAGKLRINLLLNRASVWADVDSHIPYVGQVDVKIKQLVDLEIRIPEWVGPEEVKTTVNGKERKTSFDGRYNKIGSVKPSDIVTMTFPIKEREDKVYIEKKQYSLVRKGNDVVCIDPPGHYGPLYQRAHYRQNNTRWKKVTRFISNDRLCW